MLRVAIVGLGPKGMFALERLLDHAAGLDCGTQIEVDAFEPYPIPGAGPVYDPDQPAYLRMNFDAHAVDMWWPANTTVPLDERRSFVAWRDSLPGVVDRERYPPRALVGRYLADGLQTVLRHAPPNTRARLRATQVRALRARRDGWEVVGADRSDGPYDEVLLATGHEQGSDRGLAGDWTHPAVLIPSVFPVSRRLSPERVAPGATVAARGFALSFIDAALALTEGRGGSFQAVDHPYRLRYSPADADADAAVILPFSRTGRPMPAKPDPGLAAGVPALEAIAEHGRDRILRLADGLDLQRDLLPILTEATQANLLATGDRATIEAAQRVRAWVSGAAGGFPMAAECGPAQEIERSLAVSAGLRPPDLPWALGHTWRTLYPALVRRLGENGLAEHHWPAFRRLATEMERLAFGPPAGNAAKLLALIDAGRIDLTHVRGSLTSRPGRTWLRSEHGECAVDVVIDAVLAAPGARDTPSELLRRLIDDGHARVIGGRRGLDVGADGRCRGADGHETTGLSAIGRPTEDAVIGNDTLSRTLHPLADHWARRIVQRCREDGRSGRALAC